MKQFLRNASFAIMSLALITILFGGGYFIGKKVEGDNSAPVNVLNPASPDKAVDFAPFWKVWNLIDEKYVASGTSTNATSEERVYGAIRGLVESLDDPYTNFLDPEESQSLKDDLQGNFEGVGMEVGLREEILTVISPIKGSPAEKAGIRSGDKIIQIDELSTRSISLSEAVKNIKGPAGSKVTLTIVREGIEKPFPVEITRDVISVPALEYEKLDDGIFLIKIHSFSSAVTQDFRKALREFVLSRSTRLIVDLRGNPGGYLEAAVDISSWFLPAGQVVVKESFGNGQEEKVFRSKGYDVFNDNLKLVILVDEGSASASEIMAGALKENGVAKLVGKKTFGKGSVQEVVPVTSDTSLKITVAQWLTPNGTSISKEGLMPDYEVTNEYKETGELVKDLQLEKAIELVK